MRLFRAVITAFWEAIKRRKVVPRAGRSGRTETADVPVSLPKEAKNACTKVQVFHSRYREKEAKTVAKVETNLTCLFSVTWMELERVRPVLGDWFEPQNVTCVPSVLCRE